MSNINQEIKIEIEDLIEVGEEIINKISDINFFKQEYQQWYTKSYEVVRQLTPNRLNDFTKIYDNDKMKPQSDIERGVNHFLLGNSIMTHNLLPKLVQQLSILKSAHSRFSSLIFDIRALVQADVFDSEIETAKALLKNGYIRAAGAICGVIIEKHLSLVCFNHSLKIIKKNPTIADFNDLLKTNEVIGLEDWRFIQWLGDLRNLCSHNKNRDPNVEEINNLIEGTNKIIKTIF